MHKKNENRPTKMQLLRVKIQQQIIYYILLLYTRVYDLCKAFSSYFNNQWISNQWIEIVSVSSNVNAIRVKCKSLCCVLLWPKTKNCPTQASESEITDQSLYQKWRFYWTYHLILWLTNNHAIHPFQSLRRWRILQNQS